MEAEPISAAASFHLLSQYATVVTVSLLTAFSLLIAYRLFTGAINTTGLIDDKTTGGPSPARVQLLLLSIGGAFYYLFMVVDVVQSNTAQPLTLPDPPNELLAVVIGSNTVYITAKATAAARRISGLLSGFR